MNSISSSLSNSFGYKKLDYQQFEQFAATHQESDEVIAQKFVDSTKAKTASSKSFQWAFGGTKAIVENFKEVLKTQFHKNDDQIKDVFTDEMERTALASGLTGRVINQVLTALTNSTPGQSDQFSNWTQRHSASSASLAEENALLDKTVGRWVSQKPSEANRQSEDSTTRDTISSQTSAASAEQDSISSEQEEDGDEDNDFTLNFQLQERGENKKVSPELSKTPLESSPQETPSLVVQPTLPSSAAHPTRLASRQDQEQVVKLYGDVEKLNEKIAAWKQAAEQNQVASEDHMSRLASQPPRVSKEVSIPPIRTTPPASPVTVTAPVSSPKSVPVIAIPHFDAEESKVVLEALRHRPKTTDLKLTGNRVRRPKGPPKPWVPSQGWK